MAAKAASSSSPGTMTPTSPEAGQHTHTADLLRMTRESMNGSFSARFNPAGRQQPLLNPLMLILCKANFRFASSNLLAANRLLLRRRLFPV